MKKDILVLAALFDELWFELRWYIKQDIRRLVHKMRPIRDIETKEKIYRVEPEVCDHDATQYCMFCDDITETKCVIDSDKAITSFCGICGYELTAYDMESE